jgi:hypothetical protein
MPHDMTDDPPLPRYHDLTGQVFSRLTVLSYEGRASHDSLWLCQCSCGTKISAYYQNLTRGHVRSCGCMPRKKKEPPST